MMGDPEGCMNDTRDGSGESASSARETENQPQKITDHNRKSEQTTTTTSVASPAEAGRKGRRGEGRGQLKTRASLRPTLLCTALARWTDRGASDHARLVEVYNSEAKQRARAAQCHIGLACPVVVSAMDASRGKMRAYAAFLA